MAAQLPVVHMCMYIICVCVCLCIGNAQIWFEHGENFFFPTLIRTYVHSFVCYFSSSLPPFFSPIALRQIIYKYTYSSAIWSAITKSCISSKVSAYQRRCSSVCLSSIRQWGSWRVFVCVLCRSKKKSSFLTIVSKIENFRNKKYVNSKNQEEKNW